MTTTTASCALAAFFLLGLSLPMEWHGPQDDLINRPTFDCYGARSICADRMLWLAPVAGAESARTK